MPADDTSGGSAAKGRVVGFVALGALLLLVGVAVFSSRDQQEMPPPGGAAAQPAPSQAAPAGETAPPVTTPQPLASGKGSIISAVLEDVALSPKARLLAERFKCVCDCGDILATCSCQKTPGSRDMKKYLQQLVTEGKTPAEVESAMVERYGEKALP